MHRLIKIFRIDNTRFFEDFDRAGLNTLRGAKLLNKMLENPDRKTLARDIIVCEHEGDEITKDIATRLNRTFVTPFEREDILDLSTEIDDVLDFIEEIADYLGLYRIKEIKPHAVKQSEILLKATKEISIALPKLHGFNDISGHLTEIYRLEHEGDRVVREAIAKLFKSNADPKMLMAWKDLFERLEDAIDATEKVANTLKGIVIRNS